MSSHEERLRMYNEGLNDREIGDILGLTASSIGFWRRKNNLPTLWRGKTKREIEQERLQLYNEGYSTNDMADILGVHQSTISHWKRKRGLSKGLIQIIGAFERERIIVLTSRGKSSADIARELGVKPGVISYWKRKLNLPRGEIRPRTEDEVETLKKMYNEGHIDRVIAEKLNRPPQFVFRIRKELGLKTKYIPGSQFEAYQEEKYAFNREVINLYHQNPEWSWKDIVKAVDLEVNYYNIVKIKLIIGEHLIRVCRSQENCALKPLLPEYVSEK